ncbi:hypothetical protein [Aurantibacillus circumpalustris]|uniref:hypothetical protein n=1 Tax=Aurantibacillus circumpalustris TaxID=3036359 RepID=UPI00295B7FD3|nr:hypothetical protein [Aurantibacillus circumpalustris]
MKNQITITLLCLGLVLLNFSCKKSEDERVKPNVEFKTGGSYTSGDKTLNKKEKITVGIKATKTEDELKTFNVSYTFDGAGSPTTFYNYELVKSEYDSFSKDIDITARDQAGTENWIFSITDRDGNITQKTIVLTVN